MSSFMLSTLAAMDVRSRWIAFFVATELRSALVSASLHGTTYGNPPTRLAATTVSPGWQPDATVVELRAAITVTHAT